MPELGSIISWAQHDKCTFFFFSKSLPPMGEWCPARHTAPPPPAIRHLSTRKNHPKSIIQSTISCWDISSITTLILSFSIIRSSFVMSLLEISANIVFNPNHHGPLKLLNCHGLDGKSWFKKQGPLWALGRDYKAIFWLYYESCPPPLPVLEKNVRNTQDFILNLNTLIMLRS